LSLKKEPSASGQHITVGNCSFSLILELKKIAEAGTRYYQSVADSIKGKALTLSGSMPPRFGRVVLTPTVLRTD
jgi:hypothetical protein